MLRVRAFSSYVRPARYGRKAATQKEAEVCWLSSVIALIDAITKYLVSFPEWERDYKIP